jgi:hypothetical protein
MSRRRWSVVRLLPVLALLLPAAVWGTTVMQMDLADLCQRADRIFRGRVVEITSGEVAVGGGLMPTVTYVLEVEEAFKGAFTAAKGRRLVAITMLGKLAPAQVGSLRRVVTLAGLPALEQGGTYLLLTSAPGPSGLATTLGLGQGCFQVGSIAGAEMAVNGFDNQGLLAASPLPGPAAAGPMRYEDLAAAIRQVLTTGEEGP